ADKLIYYSHTTYKHPLLYCRTYNPGNSLKVVVAVISFLGLFADWLILPHSYYIPRLFAVRSHNNTSNNNSFTHYLNQLKDGMASLADNPHNNNS
ncbi:3752_t:CDS:1, partial [Ambispora gerdemannii]